MEFLLKKAMNKLFPLIFFIILSSCNNNDIRFEKCADTMFMLTNELMKKRMPTEAKSTKDIEGFNAKSFSIKKEYEFYVALIKICEIEYLEDPKKFNDNYK